MTVDSVALREWLRHWQFWALELLFIALVVLTWINLPRLWRRLQPTARSSVGMIAVSALMAFLVIGVAPRTNRIYYDEHIYESVAQNMADLHLAQVCNDGNLEYGALSCARTEYNKEPQGFPYLLSIPYRIAGTSELAAHRLNAVCAIALCWVVFLTSLLLFGSERASVLAALILALIPQQLTWSATAAAEPSAALMSMFAIMTAVYHARCQSWASLAWMSLAIVFAAQVRMEVALVVPIALVVALVYAPAQLIQPRILAVAAIGVIAGAPHLLHLLAVSGESWGSSGDRLSLEYFWPNLSVNGPFYFGDARFPVVVTALAIAGAVIRPTRGVIVALAAALLFWGIFVFFYAGSYNFGADIRFSLMSNGWIAIVAGRGAAVITAAADRRWANDRRALAVAVTALLLQFSWYLPQVRAIGEEAWAARADVGFAREFMPRLPPNSIVLTHNPSVFHLNGVSAAQLSLINSEPDYVAGYLAERYAGGLYLHWNAWCGYYDVIQREFCASALNTFDSELIAERREREFRYAFYRLKTSGTIRKSADP